MKVSWHDHVGIDPQIFFLDTEIQTIGGNFAGSFLDEDGQPFNDGEGDVI